MRPSTLGRPATLVAVAVASLALLGCGGGGGDEEPTVRPADEGIEGVVAIRVTSADHTDGDVDYDRRPPAGGDHHSVPAPCGFYAEPVRDEHVVHSMEHGAVWLAYAPDLPAAELDAVRALVAGEEETIATPYPGLEEDTALVVTSWARQLTVRSVDDARVREFVEQYRDGDQAPEGGVECPTRSG